MCLSRSNFGWTNTDVTKYQAIFETKKTGDQYQVLITLEVAGMPPKHGEYYLSADTPQRTVEIRQHAGLVGTLTYEICKDVVYIVFAGSLAVTGETNNGLNMPVAIL